MNINHKNIILNSEQKRIINIKSPICTCEQVMFLRQSNNELFWGCKGYSSNQDSCKCYAKGKLLCLDCKVGQIVYRDKDFHGCTNYNTKSEGCCSFTISKNDINSLKEQINENIKQKFKFQSELYNPSDEKSSLYRKFLYKKS